MIYILAAIILTPVSIVAFAKWLSRQTYRNHPCCDDEGEIEEFLADRLAVCLSKEAAR
jgi:hypothetical protein